MAMALAKAQRRERRGLVDGDALEPCPHRRGNTAVTEITLAKTQRRKDRLQLDEPLAFDDQVGSETRLDTNAFVVHVHRHLPCDVEPPSPELAVQHGLVHRLQEPRLERPVHVHAHRPHREEVAR